MQCWCYSCLFYANGEQTYHIIRKHMKLFVIFSEFQDGELAIGAWEIWR